MRPRLSSTLELPRSDASAANSELTSLYKFGIEANPSRMHTSQSLSSFDRDGDLETINSSSGNPMLLASGKTLKVVSGSQFRLTNSARAMGPCEQCLVWDKTNRKNKETIRSLKLQLMRMEESYRDLKFVKGNDVEQETKLNSIADVKSVGGEPNLRRKCEYLEEELNKTKKMLSYERTVNDGLRHSLDQDRTLHKALVDTLQQENGKLRSNVDHLESSSAYYIKAFDEAQEKLLSYKQQLEKAEKKLSECMDKLSLVDAEMLKETQNKANLELQRLKQTIEQLEDQNKTHQYTIGQKNSSISQLENRVAELAAQLQASEGSNELLSAEMKGFMDSNKNLQDQVNTMKKRCDVLEATVKITTQERDAAKAIIPEKDSDLASKLNKIQRLEAETRDLSLKLDQLTRSSAQESDTNKRALEKAISSSVRLCVVAPTVNVHVNDTKHKFKSKISDAALKQFLDSEIFDKFCFLFKQSGENSAPNGASLEGWLQRMLSQMQSAIEAHVNSAMDGSSL